MDWVVDRGNPAFKGWFTGTALIGFLLLLASVVEAQSQFPLISGAQRDSPVETPVTSPTLMARLRVTVHWAGEDLEPQILPVDRDKSLCGDGGTVQFVPLRLGPGKSVQGAWVLLSEVSSSLESELPRKARVEIRNCELLPRSSILAMGGELELQAMDETATDLVLESPSGANREVALPGRLARQTLRLREEGVWTLRTPGRPWVWSQILVSRAHRGYPTDSRGSVPALSVPAGRYRVEVWHPPVSLHPNKVRGLVQSYRLGPSLRWSRVLFLAAGATQNPRVDLAP